MTPTQIDSQTEQIVTEASRIFAQLDYLEYEHRLLDLDDATAFRLNETIQKIRDVIDGLN